jgi:hypothetical protein
LFPCPRPSHREDRRLSDGTIVHNCATKYRASQIIRAEGSPADQSPRIVEDKGRGSEIHSREDQGKLLQYWAWAQILLDVGIIFPTKDARTYEFWLELSLKPMPEDDGDPMFYFRVIKELWMERLRKDSPYVAYAFDRDHLADDFSVKMRYVFNEIRIWYVPNSSLQAGFTRSLAEEPVRKISGSPLPD